MSARAPVEQINAATPAAMGELGACLLDGGVIS
jgi:hypothetical protein